MLLVLGVAAISLCHIDTASRGSAASTAAVSGHGDEATHSSTAHEHEKYCDEGGSVLADQRTGSFPASALLGLGIFASVGLPVLPPRPVPVPRSARRHRTLPLGGTRALVSLCIRRV